MDYPNFVESLTGNPNFVESLTGTHFATNRGNGQETEKQTHE